VGEGQSPRPPRARARPPPFSHATTCLACVRHSCKPFPSVRPALDYAAPPIYRRCAIPSKLMGCASAGGSAVPCATCGAAGTEPSLQGTADDGGCPRVPQVYPRALASRCPAASAFASASASLHHRPRPLLIASIPHTALATPIGTGWLVEAALCLRVAGRLGSLTVTAEPAARYRSSTASSTTRSPQSRRSPQCPYGHRCSLSPRPARSPLSLCAPQPAPLHRLPRRCLD
jgi:hypothetical protein